MCKSNKKDYFNAKIYKSIVLLNTLSKSNKKDYFNAKIYKSIVLLNTLSKILKFIIFEHLQNIMKACDLISDIQMKAHKHKSMNTTLQLITEKIYIV